MNAQKILEMIENVDPADSAAMDEIDARVWCYVHEEEYGLNPVTDTHSFKNGFGGWTPTSSRKARKYSRSRDALKAIRPMAFCHTLTYVEMEGFQAAMTWVHNIEVQLVSPPIWDETLAELHAIIQAIEWERTPRPSAEE